MGENFLIPFTEGTNLLKRALVVKKTRKTILLFKVHLTGPYRRKGLLLSWNLDNEIALCA